MRKKFLSAFMLGLLALGTTSTMVSCKDYDDDISSLKSQIKSLEDLIAQKEATINSSIANLQSAIDKANNDHATKAALQEAVTTLENAIKSETADRIAKDAELSAAIAKAQGAADAAAKLADENKNAIQKVADDLASANKNLNTLSENLKKAEGEIGELKAALAAQITACEKANSELKQEVADLKKYVDQQDEALQKALQGEIDAINSNIGNMDELNGYDNLVDAHNANAANIKTLQDALDQVTKVKIPALEAKLGELDLLTKALAKDLTSLVFIPNLYVDGIETIEYPFLKDTALVKTKDYVVERTRKVTVDGRVEDVHQKIQYVNDYVIPTPKDIARDEIVYGPAWPVEYHLNPSNANPVYADVKGFTCRRVDVTTRGVDNSLQITSPEKYDDGTQLYGIKDGIVTVGLKIGKPKQLLYNWPEAWTDADEDGLHGFNGITESQTGKRSEGKENIVALQIARALDKDNTADTIITSDYAMLQPEVLHPEAIVWTKSNDRGELGTVDEDYSHSWHWPVYTPWAPGQKGNQGVHCPMVDDKTFHVWDTPDEALTHTQGVRKGATIEADDYGTPDLILPWNDEKGLVLSEYIGTHVLNVCPLFKTTNKDHNWMKTWKFGEEQKWGLHYEFELVNYHIDGNFTEDSKYCEMLDAKTGHIAARDVDENGETVKGVPATNNNNSVVGREPLVRVKLMTADNRVVLDAYVLVRIGQKVVKEDTELAYHDYEWEFDLCNATALDRTKWAEFDTKVLDVLNITKENFDSEYELDIRTDWPIAEDANGGTVYSAKVYKKDGNKFVEDLYTDYDGTLDGCGKHNPHKTWFGNVFYFHNKAGVNNHAFRPDYTEDELEYLTHDQTTPVTKTVYVRYKSKDKSSKYANIYLKFTVKITRAAAPETGIKTKDDQYWFAFDGNKEGWDAVSLNLDFPADMQIPTIWSNGLLETFVANDYEGDGHKTTNHIDYTNKNFHKPGYIGTGDYTDIALGQYRKFFFAPINTEITDCQGVTWIITSKPGCDDQVWDAFVCAGNICCADEHKEPNTPQGYNHNTWEKDLDGDGTPNYNSHPNKYSDVKPNTNKDRDEFRGVGLSYGYVEGCDDNLHMTKKYTTHKFQTTGADNTVASNDAKNSEILQKCAIDYNEGVFTNNALYVVKKSAYKTQKKFTKIAEMNQETGQITLVREDLVASTRPEHSLAKTPNTGTDHLYWSPLDMVLNAVGYMGDQHENISKELHTMVGVVVNNGCGVAVDLFQTRGEKDINYSIFQTSWQRPINLITEYGQVWDADNNGDGLSVLDLIKLYDWRGKSYGWMQGEGRWLWGYYNVHKIIFDLNPAHVMTTLHKSKEDCDPADLNNYWPLEKASNLVHLWAADSYNAVTGKYVIATDKYLYDSPEFDFTKFAREHNGLAAEAYAKLLRDEFGYIYYENNHDNVTTFYVRIPVKVCYEWGHLCDYITVKINATEGNENSTAKK